VATAAAFSLRRPFPPTIVAQCVLLRYVRFPVSVGAMEEMLPPRRGRMAVLRAVRSRPVTLPPLPRLTNAYTEARGNPADST